MIKIGNAIDATRRVIGIDIDNVLAATDAKIRELILLHYGVASTRESITRWNYHDSLSITASQEKFILDEFHKHYCETLSVIPGAREALGKLVETTQVWLLTQRPRSTRRATIAWLANNHIPYKRLIFTREKTLYAKVLEFLVEDNGTTARAIARLGCRVLLMDYPWNRKIGYSRNIVRVQGWDEILVFVTTGHGSSGTLHGSI